jgi:hypothetical protein
LYKPNRELSSHNQRLDAIGSPIEGICSVDASVREAPFESRLLKGQTIFILGELTEQLADTPQTFDLLGILQGYLSALQRRFRNGSILGQRLKVTLLQVF